MVDATLLIFLPRRFKVMDDERLRDDLAAWACFRLDRLQSGYRMIHLYNADGMLTKGFLFVKITIKFGEIDQVEELSGTLKRAQVQLF